MMELLSEVFAYTYKNKIAVLMFKHFLFYKIITIEINISFKRWTKFVKSMKNNCYLT